MRGPKRQAAASDLMSRKQDVQDKLFEAALGIEAPWFVKAVQFDAAAKVLTIRIVIFLIAAKFDFNAINPHAGQFT